MFHKGKNGIKASLRSESGIAMITSVVIAAVFLTVSAGIYFMASREVRMSQADFSGGEAFYYAEGGVEHALDILNYAGTESQLTQQRSDQSLNGAGYLVDPNPAKRQDPLSDGGDPIVMTIGSQSYTVWADEVDQNGNHCTNGCPLNLAQKNSTAYLLITAEAQGNPLPKGQSTQAIQGYRKLQQMVMLKSSSYPRGLFVHGDADVNGATPSIINQNLYVEGNLYNRSKLSITGVDPTTGTNAGVWATGLIYANRSGTASNIYNSSGGKTSYYNSIYNNNKQPKNPQPSYDRDSNGGATYGKFTTADLNSMFDTSGLSAQQLTILKTQAISSGYYLSSSQKNVVIQDSDLQNLPCGNIVVYVEFPSGNPATNNVNIKFAWPPSGCNTGKAIVVVLNASVKMTGSAIGSNFQGIIYSPDGPVTADGGGGGSFTGFVWATAFGDCEEECDDGHDGHDGHGNEDSCAGFNDIGNFNFNLTSDFFADLPFFTWNVTRMTDWTEVDS